MVIDSQLVAFVVVAGVLTIVPGADMALVARNVVAHGRQAGYLTSVGCCTGLLVHAIASALGLSAILMTSATLFTTVKLAGAAYLVALGVTSLRRAIVAGSRGPTREGERAEGGTSGAARALVQGLMSNLLNPKVALFYLTLLPQFVRPGDRVLARSLLLAGVHVVLGLAWLFVYAYFLGRISETLRRPRVARAMEGVTGTLLIGLGARLAWERR
jgi:threonine/homoserine/homoserine lactone efflux protein